MTVGSPLSTAHLPRPDPARGVFETILVADGHAVELDAHIARLLASARELFGAPTAARLAGPARALAEAQAAASTAALTRLRLVLAPDARGALDLSATMAAVEPETVFPPPERGATLAPVEVVGGLGAHKWADRRLLDGAFAPRGPDGAQEAPVRRGSADGGRQAPARASSARPVPLLVDGDGSVLEAERANVFAVLDGTLVTPPLDGRILPGVARARTIEIAGQLGIAVDERPLSLAGLDAVDEIFLTGSIRGIEPVRGALIAARLADELRRRWLD